MAPHLVSRINPDRKSKKMKQLMAPDLDLRMNLDRKPKEKKQSRRRRSRSMVQDDNDWSDASSQPEDDDHVTEIFKDSDLYLSARNGNLDAFKRLLELDGVSADEVLSRLSPVGNTYLHVAAKHQQDDIVTYLGTLRPSLLLSKNFNGETALHVAAKAGNYASMVSLLLLLHRYCYERGLLREKDGRGNMALHVALINGHDSVAKELIGKDPELAYGRNNAGESALYLAARSGFADCVSPILRVSGDEERMKEMFGEESPIAAAIRWNHRDVLEAIFSSKPSLIEVRDREGRTPLHYAASFGHLDDVRYLLKKCADNAIRRDKSGSFPIHLASRDGHADVVRFLLQDFPDPAELLDREGRNVLHLAAMNGRSNVADIVLKDPDLAELINMKDRSGNAPLHLAAIHMHPKIVHALTWDKRVDIKVYNDEEMSALDAAHLNMSNNPPFSGRLTWAALISAGTPLYHFGKPTTKMPTPNPDIYKERVNTFLLVATLVATVTFAAGFTVPGGYNSSPDKNPGMATMLSDKGFHVFVFCDTVAMYTSIVAVVALIWAQLHDITLVIRAINLALPMLGIALSMMSMAFTAGLFVAISELRWLATAVLVMGGAFTAVLFLLILLLCTPLTPRNRMWRCISYYPFRVLALACSR